MSGGKYSQGGKEYFMSIKGTRTEKNLLTAFCGESQARNRYTYFASKAKNEGYVQISAIFEETANQEKEHAKRLFKFLEGGEVEITAAFPAGVIGTTAENLAEAAGGENSRRGGALRTHGDVSGIRKDGKGGGFRGNRRCLHGYRRRRKTA